MEDVRPTRDRGQLILVTGLSVAVVLVALVLLLNTVVYTENLATRGADVGGRDAVAFGNAAESGVARVLVTENAEEYATWTNASANVTDGVDRYARLLERGHLERATLASVSNLSVANGTRLRQDNASRTFVDLNGDANWTLATGVGERDLRRVRFDVTRSGLASSTAQAFRVVLDDGTDRWTAFVYRDGDDVTVATATGGSPTDVCSVDAPEARVDLTAGTLAGRSCSGLAFAEDVDGAYDVAYRYGANAEGTYSLVVNTSSGATVETANVDGPGPAASPYYTAAVYSAAFDVRYVTPRLTYAREVRVAPGENDG